MINALKRPTRQSLRALRRIFQTFHPLPICAAVATYGLLAWNGQLHELLLAAIAPPNLINLTGASLALLALSLLLYFSFLSLSGITVDLLFSLAAFRPANWLAFRLRETAAALIAAAPFFGVMHCAWNAAETIDRNRRGLVATYAQLPQSASTQTAHSVLLGQLDSATNRLHMIIIAAACVALVMIPLIAALRHYRRFRYWLIASFVFANGAFFLLMPYFLDLGGTHRKMGSIVVVMLTIAAGFSIVWFFAWTSHKAKLPILSGSVVAVTLWFVVQLASVTRVPEAARAPLPDLVVAPSKKEIHDQFREWLSGRADRPAYVTAKRPYPIFIVASQGGGIYAATQTALFLSRLQDICPTFGQHVFAISSVSGGSIGSTVFHDIARTSGQVPTARCAELSWEVGSNERRASEVLLADHLSAVAGVHLADWVSPTVRSVFSVGPVVDRAVALERSLEVALAATRPNQVPPENTLCVDAGISRPYPSHWCGNSAVPALILNATSADTGHRIAFSPFPLRRIGDGTLLAFTDIDSEFDKRSPSLIAGAVTSARFPFIMPAFQWMKGSNPSSVTNADKARRKWNFVDGGFADNSGATTAYEIYNALRSLEQELGFQLRLIVLTSRVTEVTYDTIDGTSLADTIAPVSAMLRVRDLLGQQAITRVRNHLPERGLNQVDPNWSLTTIALDHESLTLALGWTLSRTTHDLVALESGRPQFCTTGQTISRPKDGSSAAAISPAVILRNSCAYRAIMGLLSIP